MNYSVASISGLAGHAAEVEGVFLWIPFIHAPPAVLCTLMVRRTISGMRITKGRVDCEEDEIQREE